MVGCGRGEVGVCGAGGGRVVGGQGVGVCGSGGGGGVTVGYTKTKGMIRSGGGDRQTDVSGGRGVGVRWGGCRRQVVGVGGGRNQVVGGGGGFRGCPGLLYPQLYAGERCGLLLATCQLSAHHQLLQLKKKISMY